MTQDEWDNLIKSSDKLSILGRKSSPIDLITKYYLTYSVQKLNRIFI